MLSTEMIQLITLHDLVQDVHEVARINASVDADVEIHIHSSDADTGSLLVAAALMGWHIDQLGGTVWASSNGSRDARVTVFASVETEIAAAELWADLMGYRQSEDGWEIQMYLADLSPAQSLEKHHTDPEHSLVYGRDFIASDPGKSR